MLIYVIAKTAVEYHDYLRREGIHEDAARYVATQEIYDSMMERSKTDPWSSRLVVVGFPEWFRAAA